MRKFDAYRAGHHDARIDWKRIAMRYAMLYYLALRRAGYGHDVAMNRTATDLALMETFLEVQTDVDFNMPELATLKDFEMWQDRRQLFKQELADRVMNAVYSMAIKIKNLKLF